MIRTIVIIGHVEKNINTVLSRSPPKARGDDTLGGGRGKIKIVLIRSPPKARGDVYVKECQEKNSIPVTIVNTPF